MKTDLPAASASYWQRPNAALWGVLAAATLAAAAGQGLLLWLALASDALLLFALLLRSRAPGLAASHPVWLLLALLLLASLTSLATRDWWWPLTQPGLPKLLLAAGWAAHLCIGLLLMPQALRQKYLPVELVPASAAASEPALKVPDRPTPTATLERHVSERTAQLHQAMRNWKQRSAELTQLTRMSAALQAAKCLPDACQLIGQQLPEIFGQYGGAVYLRNTADAALCLQGEWGGFLAAQKRLAEHDCHSLQRGCEHRVDDPADPTPCRHLLANREAGPGFAQRNLEAHSCMPILVEGTAMGMIYLQWSERSSSEVSPPDKVLLTAAAEQIGLAMHNLQLRERLEHQAVRDALTGLYNRRFLDEYLQRRVAEAARSHRGFSVLVFDLDHFKSINDRYGHDGGDHVLREFAHMLQKRVRADEAAFRLGGEEFVLVLNSDHSADIQGCGERVRSGTEKLALEFKGQSLPLLTLSGGAASYPAHATDIACLIRAADQALYEAKRSGRNRICQAAIPDAGAMLHAVA